MAASDEIVWQIINQQFCAFKLSATKEKSFCRNEYNVTGLCNRQSCPLANSRYATVRQGEKGKCYLYMKTIERNHMPSKQWERIRLSNDYKTALAQIDERLQFFPKFLIHKSKQRLTRLCQVAIRMRRIAVEEERLGERLVPKLAPKVRHRERAREIKAERAAKLERTIERELIDRLRQGVYGDQPLNVSEQIWKKVLNHLEREGEGVRDKDMDKGIEAEEEDEEEEVEAEMEEQDDDAEGQVEYVSDFDESEDELGDIEDWLGSEDDEDSEEDSEEDDEEGDGKKKISAGKRKKGRVVRMKSRKKRLTEIEQETETQRQRLVNVV